MRRRLILVGAGHAHLEVMRLHKNNPLTDIEMCLINPSNYQYYSGMFSGYAEGLYTEEETRIDLTEFAERCGVHFIKKKASRVFPERKKLFCEGGAVYPFDIISFDIGSKSIPYEFAGSDARSVKPNYQFVEQMNSLRATSTPLIVGGGAAGCELAVSIQTFKNKHEIAGNVRLVTSSNVLADSPRKTSKKLKSILEETGVQIWENEKVKDMYDECIVTEMNNRIRHTGVLWLGGPLADPIFTLSNIDVDTRGFAYVKATLQFEKYSFIFGAGDCVTLRTYPHLDKSGVYAVRQGPVLFENLKAYLDDEPLKKFEPQKKAMYILSAGKKKGLLMYGGFSHYSGKAWNLKNKIDTNFMKKYK
ncbi:FAD-dependent oxidoreductase [Halobacillus campisalis]|uniref:FAD-dependent oxidoreductase n=1 Tax=Halobacillus campisalis TaxID=435909 RepID=A0ABW2K8G1_9BACI|nr:FAD-dependent oxidoreductase [Halobacillus campisalis]